MKLLLGALLVVIAWLQYEFWLGEDGYGALRARQAEAVEQRALIAELREGNRQLEIEALDLKEGTEAIEERARLELGMIKEGETFHIIVDAPE